MKQALLSAAVAALAALGSGTSIADTVKLVGSGLVGTSIIEPNRDAIESSTGHTLQLASVPTSDALVDLVEKRADIAMLSSSVDVPLEIAAKMGRKIDPASLRVHALRTEEIVFIVNPSNPVPKLTMAQLGDIHTGKITNWKQVGGRDVPIRVYTSNPKGSTYAMVQQVAMNGADYVAGTKVMNSVARISDLVPGDEGGIGAMSRGSARTDGKTRIVETPKIARELLLVTLGEPSGKVRQVVEAAKNARK
jgi:phosphate transport system substrate-binding protein